MIRGYEISQPLPAECEGRLQWSAALKAGLAAGVVLLVIARGNPWAGLTLFSPVVMGRMIPPTEGVPLLLAWLIHVAVAVIYGMIISFVVVGLSRWRAILAGGVVGFGLYFGNWAVVHFLYPAIEGHEAGVLSAHIVFGLLAAGAYRGFLKRRQVTKIV